MHTLRMYGRRGGRDLACRDGAGHSRVWRPSAFRSVRRRANCYLVFGVALVIFFTRGVAVSAEVAVTERASVAASGNQGDTESSRGSVSADGRYVAFYSDAGNLVPGDEPTFDSTTCPACTGVRDVFVRDRTTGVTIRVSINAAGEAGNGKSDRPSISATGRFIAFTSDSDNLVLGDTNGERDIFVHDRDADQDGVFDESGAITTTRVSVSSAGTEGDGRCNMPVISANGRHVVFRSRATNLIVGGTSGADHIFAHDRQLATTVLVSASSGGAHGNADSDRPAVSSDGRFVAFHSDAGNLVPGDQPTYDPITCPSCVGFQDVFVRDRDPDQNGIFDEGNATTERISVSTAGTAGNGASSRPRLSADGRYVLFKSSADNLVSGDSNNADDAFVRDRLTNTTVRVSVSSSGAQAVAVGPASGRASISSDGRHIAYFSEANDLVPGDTNGAEDVFVRDRQAGTTVRVSVSSGGVAGNGDSNRPSISEDGRYVAFYSDAYNLVPGDEPSFDANLCPECTGVRDIFVHDRDPDENGVFDEGNGTTQRVSISSLGVPANGDCTRPSVSGGGRYVAFRSSADNLVPGDTNGLQDVFVHDRQTGETVRMSVSSAGAQSSDGDSEFPSLSSDGRYVAFWSLAGNLAPGDDPPYDAVVCPACIGVADIFVRDRDPDGNGTFDEGNGTTTRVSVSTGGTAGDGASDRPSVSPNGRYVGFISDATNLIGGDTNGHTDVFVHDLQSGTTTRVSVASDGSQGDYGSDRVSFSADGRFVAFRSKADNLVAGDLPSFDVDICPTCTGERDVFVHDRDPDQNGLFDEGNGVTTRISVSSLGDPGDRDMGGPQFSSDGTVIAMVGAATNLVGTDTNYSDDVFAHDRLPGSTERISVATGGTQASTPIAFVPDSDDVDLSADGRFVSFRSLGVNLVARDFNLLADIFLHDRDFDGDGVLDESGATTTQRVSVSTLGVEADGGSGRSRISADGTTIAFYSDATNLVADDTNLVRDVFVRSSTSTTCGNGHVEPGEECDDGNTTPGDGCSADCLIENPDAPPPPVPGDPNAGSRYLRMSAPSGPGGAQLEAIRVRMISLDGFVVPVPPGELWLGPPFEAPEEDSSQPNLTFTTAPLQCAPYFHDWASEGVISIYGAEIQPLGAYAIQRVYFGAEITNDVSYSAAAMMVAAKFGDIAAPFHPANAQPDFKDISACVAKFVADPAAPVKALAQLQPGIVFPDRSIDFKDISADVAAFVGTAFHELSFAAAPCTCPSAVVCGATACVNDGACGTGVCIDGGCRDQCGRCEP